MRSLFRDESKLDINYTPRYLKHRDIQLELLNQYFRHALETPGKMTQRVIVTGKVGTGKTVLTQHFGQNITREAQRRSIPLRYIHVNCRQNKGSFFLVLQRIVTEFHPTFPKRGYSAEELLQVLMQILDEQDAYLLITLDELEPLIENEGSDPLYKLTRIAESRPKEPGRLSLICILRELRWLSKLDASTRSTLQSSIITLDAYTQRKLQDILNDRIPLAFRTDVVPEETVMLVSELGEEEGGNARYAIELLWRAGKYADAEKSGEVTPEHVRKAVGSVYSTVRRDEIAALAPHEKLLLLALARRFQQTATAHLSMGDAEESYRIVCEEFDEEPRGHTQLWKYVKRLSNLGVINAIISTSGVRGKTTLIGLPRVPASDLENELTSFLSSDAGRI